MSLFADPREQLKRIFFVLLRLAGAEGRLYRRVQNAHPRPVIVLNPHQIRPEPNPFWSPLHPRLFEELLGFVSKRFFVTTLGALDTNDTERPSLVLSFDDGYHDWVEHALPLLKRHRLPCNQNVIGESLVTGKPPAIVRVCDFLGQAPRSLINELDLPGFRLKLDGDGDRAKIRYGIELCAFLKNRPRAEAAPLWEIMERHMARLDRLVLSRMMSATDVAAAAADGHEIGAHSYGHESMAFESDEFFAQDFDRCAEVFATKLALPIRVYAFPNGSYRASQIATLASRGVEHVLLVDDDYATPDAKAPRTYHRFNFYATSRGETRFRALGFPARKKLVTRLASPAGG